MRSRQEIATAFSRLDVHDDTIESIAFQPEKRRARRGKKGSRGGTIEVHLYRYWKDARRLLTFID